MRVAHIARSTLAVASVIAALGGMSAASSSAATGPSAETIAKSATVTKEDLGSDWSQYRKAVGFYRADKLGCASKVGPPLKLSGRPYSGPMFKRGTQALFAYSYALVFGTEAGAKAYTAVRSSAKYTQCVAAQDDAAAKKADRKAFVKMAQTTSPAVGTAGLEAFYQEDAGGKNADGSDVANASYVRLAYRHGRVVYLIYIDTALADDEAGRATLNTQINDAVTAMNTAIEGRVTALGA